MSKEPKQNLVIPDFDSSPPATEAQLEFLDKLDVYYDLDITRREASRLIDEALAEQ